MIRAMRPWENVSWEKLAFSMVLDLICSPRVAWTTSYHGRTGDVPGDVPRAMRTSANVGNRFARAARAFSDCVSALFAPPGPAVTHGLHGVHGISPHFWPSFWTVNKLQRSARAQTITALSHPRTPPCALCLDRIPD
eukprot:5998892-Prymnesium_polylepis.2